MQYSTVIGLIIGWEVRYRFWPFKKNCPNFWIAPSQRFCLNSASNEKESENLSELASDFNFFEKEKAPKLLEITKKSPMLDTEFDALHQKDIK
jgi:hypothetical protein